MAKHNRRFGKTDGGRNVEYAPLPLVIVGVNVWTNVPETYISEGYYPIVNTDMPEKEGCYFTSYYEQEGEVIVQKWEEHMEEVGEL